MKKMLIITMCCLGSYALGADESNELMDSYYANLDNSEIELAAYDHTSKFDRDAAPDRKRSHRRKRLIRPPVQGK